MARFDRIEYDSPDDESPELLGSRESEAGEAAWLRKADDQRRRGHYDNALRYYSRALELDKSIVAGWLGQIQMLVLLEEYDEAELWARKSLEIFKGQGDLMAARAQALGRVGDVRQAVELSDASLRQEGQSAFRWAVRGELMIAGRDDLDRHCFDKAVQLNGDWLVPMEIALVYLARKVPSKALVRARDAVDRSPDQFYAWYVQGLAEQALDMAPQAVRSYERCLQLCPNHIEAGRRLTELAVRGSWLGRGLRRLLGRD